METRTLIARGSGKEFSFNAKAKTVLFEIEISQREIVFVINQTKNTESNVTIYNFGCEDLGGVLAGRILTLEFDTTSMSDNDDLIIVIEERNVEALLMEGNIVLKCLNDILQAQEQTNKWLRKIYNPE